MARRATAKTNKKVADTMEFVAIPGTSLSVSRIALGTWAIGGWMWGGTDDEASIRTIQAALDHGVNLIDTAPVYGFGHSEEIVGKALATGGRRQRAALRPRSASIGRTANLSVTPAAHASSRRPRIRCVACRPT